jgi:hypothetical protein
MKELVENLFDRCEDAHIVAFFLARMKPPNDPEVVEATVLNADLPLIHDP